MSQNNKKSNGTKRAEFLSARFLMAITGIYLFLLCVVYPLYYEKEFSNIGDAKWHFYRMITVYAKTVYFPVPTFIFLFLAGLLWFLIDVQKRQGIIIFLKEKAVLTDAFVLAYGVLTGVACIITPYRKFLLNGYPTWYMGLWVQLGLVVTYFAVSYFWKNDSLGILIFFIVSAVVIFIAILNRYGIDPLGMYPEIEKVRHEYLSTIGQRTMYSGYLMTVFPVGVYLYWSTEKKGLRIGSLFYLIIGFMSIITADADSAILGLIGMFAVLFWFSFRDNESMKRFLEILLIMLLSWRAAGLLQSVFPDKSADTDSIMKFGSLDQRMWLVITVLAVLYVLLQVMTRKSRSFSVSSMKALRNILTAALPVMIILGIVYIILNTGNYLPDFISFGKDANKHESYLVYNDYWGNYRGIHWNTAFKTMAHTLKDDLPRFILGAGPDEYNEVLYHYCADELNAFLGKRQIVCAHNETITQFVNGGILGGLAYLGIFISAFVLSAKNSDKHSELIAVMMCIASYFFHNIFCYQRITCTPFIFVIFGAGMNIIRNNGSYSVHQ